MNNTALLSIAYLPPVQHFTKIVGYENSCMEQYENYSKQSYRNRCIILSPNGPLALSLPIKKTTTSKTLIKDVKIDDSINWQKIHQKSIETAYNSSSFYEYYIDELIPFYHKKNNYLFDFNFNIQMVLLKLLGINKTIKRTNYFQKEYKQIDDFRYTIHPKVNKSVDDKKFIPQTYFQVFEEKFNFIPNLSIIDLLFNMGNESHLFLKKSFQYSP